MKKKNPNQKTVSWFFLGKNPLQFKVKHMLQNPAQTLILEAAASEPAWWEGSQTCTRKDLNHPDQTGSRSQTVVSVKSQVNFLFFFLL